MHLTFSLPLAVCNKDKFKNYVDFVDNVIDAFV